VCTQVLSKGIDGPASSRFSSDLDISFERPYDDVDASLILEVSVKQELVLCSQLDIAGGHYYFIERSTRANRFDEQVGYLERIYPLVDAGQLGQN